MLWLKAWLETRWRVTGFFVMLFFVLGINYGNRTASPAALHAMRTLLALLLACEALALAGCGVKSQPPIGFNWEGLVGSAQFTISLPVSRLRLLWVRAATGLFEIWAVAGIIGCITWAAFPAFRATVAPLDLARVLLASMVFLSGPYLASVFFSTLLDEPLSFMCAGWLITVLFMGSHYVPDSLDIFAVWGKASPLFTHSLPWPQMALSACLALVLFLASVRVVQTREY